MGEPLDLVDSDAGDGGNLGDAGAGTDTGLDFAGAECAFHLDLDLSQPGEVAASGGAQSFVGSDPVFLTRLGVLADDMGAVDIHTDDAKFTHLLLLR
ncbi:hypothetical protein GCM10009624_17610 [Gordonia sinesedis]